MTDKYAKSGVDTGQADRALARLLLELAPTQAFGAQSEVGVGHFAAVVRVGGIQLGLTTDGVGTKTLIAEAVGRYDTIGIDCVAMNVNDLICVGAEPAAMLDFIACEDADPEVFAEIGKGLAEGARQGGVAFVGGETEQVPDMIKGSKPGSGVHLTGMAIGVVPEGDLIDGGAVEPGDAVVGVASNGVHSNGLTLARTALLSKLKLEEYVDELGHSLADELLRPTQIYVPQYNAIRAAGIRPRAVAHITGDGLLNLRRVEAPVGFEIESLPDAPAVFQLIEQLGEVSRAEMRTVFNMGVGLCVIVPESDVEKTIAAVGDTGLAAWRLGHAVADPERRIRIAPEGLLGVSKTFSAEGS